MENRFKSIKILGLDETKTSPSPRGGPLKLMYIELSDSPSDEWRKYFITARTPLRSSKSRKAWIQGKYIVIDCVPEEVEKHHMKELLGDVEKANSKMKF